MFLLFLNLITYFNKSNSNITALYIYIYIYIHIYSSRLGYGRVKSVGLNIEAHKNKKCQQQRKKLKYVIFQDNLFDVMLEAENLSKLFIKFNKHSFPTAFIHRLI